MKELLSIAAMTLDHEVAVPMSPSVVTCSKEPNKTELEAGADEKPGRRFRATRKNELDLEVDALRI
jgi:hypothetical protein